MSLTEEHIKTIKDAKTIVEEPHKHEGPCNPNRTPVSIHVPLEEEGVRAILDAAQACQGEPCDLSVLIARLALAMPGACCPDFDTDQYEKRMGLTRYFLDKAHRGAAPDVVKAIMGHLNPKIPTPTGFASPQLL